jgi:iron complex outermembrane recepter protein
MALSAAGCAGVAVSLTAVAGAALGQARSDLFDMSLEELGSLPVVSLYRRAQNLDETAASVFVITAEDIRRAGVRSIPEALRLAPGIEVARNGASSWTITIRGFSSDLSNKLLVLIDGRSVYSPLFGGVFWDVQDTLLADIARIEVISGPGGSVWGSNAVNGVVNIITRSAEQTHGGFAEAGGGAGEHAFAGLRYGGEIGTAVDARVYIKSFERDPTEALDGTDAYDAWDMSQAGFNLRWDASDDDRVTVRGDIYTGSESALLRSDFTLGTLPDFAVPGTVDVAGHNLLGRWRRVLGDDSSLRLQVFYDHTERNIPGSFSEDRDTFDVDFQQDLARVGRHAVAWGAGARTTSDDIVNTTFATFVPASRIDRTLSAFVQDRIGFVDGRVLLTVGTKMEHNDYTGFENQPNARVSWLISDERTLWAAVSRAVRTPARLNTDLRLTAPIENAGTPVPFYVKVSGNADYRSEELQAYEAGYRVQAARGLSFDLAVFANDYDQLQTQESGEPVLVGTPPPYIVLPAVLDNRMEGETYGGTFLANWQPLPRWRLRFQYSRLEMDLEVLADSTDGNATGLAGNSPRHQLGVYSFAELPHDLSVYAGARFVDELPNQEVPSYVAVDLNVAWQPTPALSVALTVQNLNDSRHLEFGDGTYLERGAYLSAAWTF